MMFPVGLLRNSGRFAGIPGLDHKGYELGYSLLHVYGAAFYNSNLIFACVIGDGESEAGALPRAGISTNVSCNPRLARSLDSSSQWLQDRQSEGLARIVRDGQTHLLRGYDYDPHFVESEDPAIVHQILAGTPRHDLGEYPENTEQSAFAQ
jgi:xylulose-5-phosphate/fructose-6-phosphate phosphoketolase